MIKIGHIARDLNIGLQTAVSFLKSKGIEVDMNPIARIDDNAVALLKSKFSSEIRQRRPRISTSTISREQDRTMQNLQRSHSQTPDEWIDAEIIKQLKTLWDCDEFIFECRITNEPFRTQRPENYKGSITNITHNGEPICDPNTGVPIYFNISKNTRFQFIPGTYLMQFELENRERRESLHNLYLLRPIYTSLPRLNEEKYREFNQKRAEQGKESHTQQELELFEYWGVNDCSFIGRYNYDIHKGMWYVDDLRKPNFAKIPFYPNDTLERPIQLYFDFEIAGLQLGNYYLFNWKLSGRDSANPFAIHIDFQYPPQPIRPQWFIERLFEDRYNDKSKNFDSSVDFLDTLSKQLSAKESTFIYELLQNASDYPHNNEKVDVEFHITDKYLLFLHSGDYFNVRNISGICGINEKEKASNCKSIGYKGIGFKTVFLNNHYVYLKTGDYSFRFDKNAKEIKRLKAPWPLLPVWTNEEELDSEILSVFKKADSKYRVMIALRPDDSSILHSGRKNYESLFKEVFGDSNIILFLSNIHSVKVFINGKIERNCRIDENKWVVNDFYEPIDMEFQQLVIKDIETGKSRIPEKYKDFETATVSFACRREGNKLLPVENATIYCYLPTSASWGFPFLMNTDMIPKGDRDDIEREVYLKDDDETNFNIELARIAGEKFFDWIQELMKSGKYDYDSIFSLIPDFKNAIKTHEKYEDFILEFQKGFETKLKTNGIVPILENKTIVFKLVREVIFDTTGLSCSGILTDEEILRLSEWQDYFPHPSLRDENKLSLKPGIKSFLSTYHDNSKKYDLDTLKKSCKTLSFQKWLTDQNNNDKFIKFLIDRGILNEFNLSSIFLSTKGTLSHPNGLYYSVDEFYEYIKSLDIFIDRLSLETRRKFSSNTKWKDFEGNFAEFDPKRFTDFVLLKKENFGEVHRILSGSENNLAFMNFLSEIEFSKQYTSFPFLDENGEIVENFNTKDFIFLNENAIREFRNLEWVNSEWIGIVSDSYKIEVIDYFKDNFGVIKEFDDDFIRNEILSVSKYKDHIISNVSTSFETNKSFLTYLFCFRDNLQDGTLSSYPISAKDKNGKEVFICENQEYIYQRTSGYSELEKLEWINSDFMYALNDAYFLNFIDPTALKAFIKNKYDIGEITKSVFIEDIVLSNKINILANIQSQSCNIDFWRWVKNNVTNSDTLSKFAEFPLLVKTLQANDFELKAVMGNVIYLSTAYQPSSGIEAIVTKFAPDALFVSPLYLETQTKETVSSWIEFFKGLGVKTTIVDLIFKHIIKNIGNIEEGAEGLPDLLGGYYNEIRDNWDEVKKDLSAIKIRTLDGKLTPIRDAILVDVNRDKEPFRSIKIDKQADNSTIESRNGRQLLLDISKEAGGRIINNLTEWQETKFNLYAGKEESYSFEVHLDIISELARIDFETVKTFDGLQKLRLRNIGEDIDYQLPKTLTLGSSYNPVCQFEKFGVSEDITYIAKDYAALNAGKEITKILKDLLKCHHKFEEEDIKYLKNFDFCIYFWSEYMPKHYDFAAGLISKGLLNNVACIPTEAGNVYNNSRVYSRGIKHYVINKIPDWEDKIPSAKIPENVDFEKDLFHKITTKTQLEFLDGLSALSVIKSREKRAHILRWMKADFKPQFAESINDYRAQPDSEWQNGKGQPRHISELYALDPESKRLRDFFQDHEYILNLEYISPYFPEEYKAICDMMKITWIKEWDMSFDPVGKQISLSRYFEERLLLIAAIENPEDWNSSFVKYKEKVNNAEFWCCSTITWKYKHNENICQNNKKFHSRDGKYYFVKDWCSRQVFSDFMKVLHEDLKCEIDIDLFISIMDPDNSIEESLKPYHNLRTEAFIAELAKYNKDYTEYDGPTSKPDDEEDDVEENEVYASIRKYNEREEAEEENSDEFEDDGISKDTNDTIVKRTEAQISSPSTISDTSDNKKEITQHTVNSSPESHTDTMIDNAYNNAKSSSINSEAPNSETGEARQMNKETGKSVHDTNEFRPTETGDSDTHVERSPEKYGDSGKLGKTYILREPKNTPKEDVERLRPKGTPLELETLPATDEEIDALTGLGIPPEQIADTNYLVKLRLYHNIKNKLEEDPEESLSEFVRNCDNTANHKLRSGKYIHACSAAKGVMYISPSIWNKLLDDNCIICVYRDGQGKNFHYINNREEFLDLVKKDDIIIKLTGQEKVKVVNELYSELLKDTRGTAYTLIRVATHTNIDALFSRYVGAMAEENDGNENLDNY